MDRVVPVLEVPACVVEIRHHNQVSVLGREPEIVTDRVATQPRESIGKHPQGVGDGGDLLGGRSICELQQNYVADHGDDRYHTRSSIVRTEAVVCRSQLDGEPNESADRSFPAHAFRTRKSGAPQLRGPGHLHLIDP